MTSKHDQPQSDSGRGRGSGGAAPIDPTRRDPAAIALRMEDLTLWAIERATMFPRNHKFTVGDRLIDTCLEVTTMLVEASYLPRGRAKLQHLHRASRALTRARLLVRVAQRLWGQRSIDEASDIAGAPLATGCNVGQPQEYGGGRLGRDHGARGYDERRRRGWR